MLTLGWPKARPQLGIPLGDINITRFPDGEISVKIIENIRGKDVFIIQPTCYPANRKHHGIADCY